MVKISMAKRGRCVDCGVGNYVRARRLDSAAAVPYAKPERTESHSQHRRLNATVAMTDGVGHPRLCTVTVQQL